MGVMNFDATKQYLNQISRLEWRIQNKLSEIYQLKTMAYNITVSSEKEIVKTSTNKDKLCDTVSKIVDLEKEANTLVDSFTEKRQHIIDQIDRMENADYYNILSMRYVGRKTFESISETTHWSIRKVFSLHNKALAKFEELYGNEYIVTVQKGA